MNGITVLIDADACPVVKTVERIAQTMFSNRITAR